MEKEDLKLLEDRKRILKVFNGQEPYELFTLMSVDNCDYDMDKHIKICNNMDR
jgi:hypothetical protein